MSIFDPQPGQSFDADGKLIEKTTDTPPSNTSVVDPVIDAPAQQTTLNADVQSTNTTSPQIDWESVLAEKTGGKFKSWDDILPKINQESSSQEQQLVFKDEESKKIFEYLREGKVDDVLQVYNEQRRLANLDKMSDKDALKMMLEYKNPSFTPEDIEEEVATRYMAEKPEEPVEDDYLDEEAFDKAKRSYQKELARFEKEQKKFERQLKLDGQTAREYLVSLQKDIILPDINPVQQFGPSPEDLQAQREADYAARNKYLESLKKTSVDFKEIPFEVNDEGVNFKGAFHIEENDRAALVKDLTEKNVVDDLILSRYVKEDSYDTAQLMEDIYWLNNKDKIIKAAIKQAIAQTDLDNLKKLKNIDLDQRQGAMAGVNPEVQAKQAIAAFLKD